MIQAPEENIFIINTIYWNKLLQLQADSPRSAPKKHREFTWKNPLRCK